MQLISSIQQPPCPCTPYLPMLPTPTPQVEWQYCPCSTAICTLQVSSCCISASVQSHQSLMVTFPMKATLPKRIHLSQLFSSQHGQPSNSGEKKSGTEVNGDRSLLHLFLKIKFNIFLNILKFLLRLANVQISSSICLEMRAILMYCIKNSFFHKFYAKS